VAGSIDVQWDNLLAHIKMGSLIAKNRWSTLCIYVVVR